MCHAIALTTERIGVGDLVLGARPPRAAAIAGRMKDDLAAVGNPFDHGTVAAEHLLQGQPRLDPAAGCRKRQRVDLVLAVELIDFLVDRVVRGMPDAKGRWVLGGLGLGEDRLPDLAGRSVRTAIRGRRRTAISATRRSVGAAILGRRMIVMSPASVTVRHISPPLNLSPAPRV
jgi:hypothetical protein